jgi:fructokinase
MVAMTMIAVIGEVVADAVLPSDGIRDGVARLTVHPGGGPANTALTLARLGTRARFGGRLSTGALGTLCRERLAASGVDLSGAVATPAPATLAIARLSEDGSATYEFYTEGTADWDWTDEELSAVVRAGADSGADSGPVVALHTGSLALALQPSGAAIERLVDRAGSTATISIDPNLRTLLVPLEVYRERITAWAPRADILRLSSEDLLQLWPGLTPEHAAARLHDLGTALVLISLGSRGALASLAGRQVRVPVAPLAPGGLVDTVGAGDSFHGGFLHHLGRAGALGGRLDDLDLDTLTAALEFASRVAAVTCSRPGADPPWASELD